MNPEQQLAILEQQLTQFLQTLQSVLSSGESLPDEFLGMLAQELQQTTQKIDQLKGQVGSVEGLTPSSGVPQLQPGPYPSSNVNSFKYDPRDGTLFVKFHGKDTADSGPVYKYQGIPKNIYDVFSRGGVGPLTSGQNKYHRWVKGVTPSLGASLYGLIKTGGYPYQRMS